MVTSVSRPERTSDKIVSLVGENSAWREGCINIVASENVSSPMVRSIVGSDFMHRYAEYEGQSIETRFNEGSRYIVEIEKIAQSLAKKLFGCKFVELRPISGHIAIISCVLAFARPGGTTLEVSGVNGGHEWHRAATNNPAVGYRPDWLPFDADDWNVDVDSARRKIRETKPDVIILGSSFYLFPHPTKDIRAAADEVGARVVQDEAHVLGLIGGRVWPNPLANGAHLFTASTHKTFPGPQKGIIMANDESLLRRVMDSVYPSLLTNHHLMNVAALAYAMTEFERFGGSYAAQVVKNAQALGAALSDQGFDVIAAKKGFTRSHQVLVRTSSFMTGNEAAKALGEAGIICNKMELEKADGLRLGTSEITRVGMKQSDMKEIAGFIGDVLRRNKDVNMVRRGVRTFTRDFRKIQYSFENGKAAYGWQSALNARRTQ